MRVAYLVSLQDKYVPDERSPEHGNRYSKVVQFREGIRIYYP